MKQIICFGDSNTWGYDGSVLRPGGILKGENRRTDWFIEHLYTPKGFLRHR